MLFRADHRGQKPLQQGLGVSFELAAVDWEIAMAHRLVAMLLLAATAAHAEVLLPAPPVEVALTAWTVPWPDTRPRDPDVAPDGDVWFVGQVGNYLARLDPETGDFERVDLPPGTKPHNLVVARDGAIWYAGNGNGTIGRYDPATKSFTTHAMPDPAARDPHTLVADGRGHLWFTVQRSNFIGRIAMDDGEVTLLPVATKSALPYGIVGGAGGEAWAVLFGTNRLARVDADASAITEIELPRSEARPRRLVRTRDGRIWWGDFSTGRLGVHDPGKGTFDEYELPSRRPGAYAMAVDDRDRVWVVESGVQPNRLVGFDTGAQEIVADVAVDAGTVRHMVFHAPSRTLWFGTDQGAIVRAALDVAVAAN
jgi:virginiamycin B lyase